MTADRISTQKLTVGADIAAVMPISHRMWPMTAADAGDECGSQS